MEMEKEEGKRRGLVSNLDIHTECLCIYLLLMNRATTNNISYIDYSSVYFFGFLLSVVDDVKVYISSFSITVSSLPHNYTHSHPVNSKNAHVVNKQEQTS